MQLAERLQQDGYQVEVVALRAAKGEHCALDVPVVSKRPTALSGFVSLVRRARDADVLIANGGTTLWWTCLAGLVSRTDFVYRNIGDPSEWGRVRFAQWRIGTPLRRAAVVAALYPDASAFLARRYRIDAERLTTIPNAVPVCAFPLPDDNDRSLAQASLGLDPNIRWVAFLGALSAEKQPLMALAALQSEQDLGLVVAGDGPLAEQCRAAASRFPKERVRLLGRVSDSRRVLVACDVVVLPSRTEGISGVAIEAGLSGRPVVASNVGGMSEAIKDEVTGILVDNPTPDSLVEAIRWALAHKVAAGTAARTHCVERFSMDEAGREWARALDQAINAATRGGSRRSALLPRSRFRRVAEPNDRA